METIIIEWIHLDIHEGMCQRCYHTGENLRNEVKRLNCELNSKGVVIQLIEKIVGCNEMIFSNSILIDGIPLEDIIPLQIKTNYCESCSSYLKKESFCRSFLYEEKEYDEVPTKVIRAGVYQILGLPAPPVMRRSCL